MVDDRRKPQRPPTHGDLRRDQRRTPPRGIVAVHVDPELTPPPQLPPPPDRHLIAPEIREQLDYLAAGLGNVTEALGKVWDARKDAEQLSDINKKLGTLAGYATEHHTLLHQQVWPAVKELMASVDGVEHELRPLANQVETMANIVKDVDKRLRDLELDVRSLSDRFNSSNQATQARLHEAENVLNALDVRITALEQKGRDEVVAIEAVAKSDERRLRWIRAAYIAGSGVIGFIVAKGAAIVSWLSGH